MKFTRIDLSAPAQRFPADYTGGASRGEAEEIACLLLADVAQADAPEDPADRGQYFEQLAQDYRELFAELPVPVPDPLELTDEHRIARAKQALDTPSNTGGEQ